MMTDDARLLTRYAEGDEGAFTELVREHIDAVYSAALRRVGGDAQLAEDVTQQVFIAAARNARQLAKHVALAGWFYSTTRNVAANVVRGERRRKSREQEALTMNETSGTDWSRVVPVLDEAIDALSDKERTLVLLRFVQRRAFAEIGTVLGISEDAARMRVDRALERLRGLLERRGVTSTHAALGLTLSAHAGAPAPIGLASSVVGAAVAGTTVTGIGLFALLQANWVPAAAILTVLCAVESTRRSDVAAQAAEARLVVAARTEAAMNARVREAEARAIAAEQEARSAAIGLARASGQLATTRASVDNSSAQSGESREAVRVANEMLERHPEIRDAMIEWQFAKVRFKFAPLIRTLGLTPEQTDRFVSLMRGEVLFGEYGPNGRFAEFRPEHELGQTTRWEQLRELLGENGYRQFRAFQPLTEAREYSAQAASQLSLTNAPLTPAQAQALLPVFGKLRGTTWVGDDRMQAWDSIVEEAGAFLLPVQIEALRRIAESERRTVATHRVQLAAAQSAETATP